MPADDSPMIPFPHGVETRPIQDLLPAARNARLHSPAQIAAIAASIQAYGFNNPVLIADDGNIIAGHGRVLAAVHLGLMTVPVVVLSHLTPLQRRAYLVADNQLTDLSSWDRTVLRDELAELAALDVDLTNLGFAATEIDALLAPSSTPEAEWQGMPEFYQPKKATAYQTVTIHFRDAEAVAAFALLIGQPVTALTRFMRYPPSPDGRQATNRYLYREEQTEPQE